MASRRTIPRLTPASHTESALRRYSNDDAKPKCHQHGLMPFDPEKGAFRCTAPGCGKVAWPKEEVFEKIPTGHGPVKLVKSGEHYFLLSENRVMIELPPGVKFDNVHSAIQVPYVEAIDLGAQT